MKLIKGHKSFNIDEIVEILKNQKSFTMCTLPHYRYNSVKKICGKLISMGYVKQNAYTETGVSLVITDRFEEWMNSGTTLGLSKFWKENYRTVFKPKNKRCKECGSVFVAQQRNHIYCSKKCKNSKYLINKPL
jgi:hypothetical protein